MRTGNAKPEPDDPVKAANSEVTLRRDHAKKIRSLNGFQKSHRVPEQADDRSNAFVARIAVEDISRHLDEIHAALRKHFQLKRREIVVSEIIEGSASITTPGFRYEVSVSIDTDDPALISWRHRMSEIVDQQSILESKFSRVFGDMFNIVEFSAPQGINIESLIDSVEELNDSGIDLKYPHDASTCTIKFAGRDVELFFEQTGMRLVHRHARPPADILQVYFDLQASLGNDIDLPALQRPA